MTTTLEQTEMAQTAQDDQSSTVAYRQTHPLDFKLLNGDEPVLYITDDTAGQRLRFEISNGSTKTIELNELNEAKEYHCRLTFRPGTLSATTLKQLTLADNGDGEAWTMIAPVKQNDGTVTVDFLHKEGLTLVAEGTIQLTLQNISADASGGSRNTQVELAYQQMQYRGDATELRGTQLTYLSIVNHSGNEAIPLHLGFAGTNTILNNGAENTLVLRVTNTSKDINLTFTDETQLTLLVDVGPNDEDWMLTDVDNAEQIEVVADGAAGEWTIHKNVEGKAPEWILTAAGGILPAGQHFQITLSNIRSSNPSGHTNLYLYYDNVPGYWDDHLTATIAKGPVVQQDVYEEGVFQGNSKVGIGTNSPDATLDVVGNISVRAADNGDDQPYTEISHDGENGYINTSASSRLDFQHEGTTQMTLTESGNLGIGIDEPATPLAIKGNGGTKAVGITQNHKGGAATMELTTTDRSGTQATRVLLRGDNDNADIEFCRGASGAEEVSLIIEGTNGNVGIGTQEPQTALHVAGEIKADRMTMGSSDTVTTDWIGRENAGSGKDEHEVRCPPGKVLVGFKFRRYRDDDADKDYYKFKAIWED